MIGAGPAQARRAISGPLTPVTRDLSRSLADTPRRTSGDITARTAQLPKLTVRFFGASGGASGSRMDREVQERPLSVPG
jgi:hypothetical protein